GRILNQIDEFDDSKMEYDRIGVIEGFPEEYRQPEQPKTEHEDVYFEDNFEDAAVLDEEKWNVAGDQVKISTQFMSEGILNGKHSLELWNASRVSRQFEENLNKIVTVKMFDRQNDNCAAYSSGVKNSPNNTTIASISNETVTLGLGTQRGQLGYYVVEVNGQRTATTVARTAGWHEFTFDVTDGENAVLYIDGTKVGAYTMTGFNKLALGTEDGVGEAHYDEVVVYGGRNAESDAKDILSFTIPNQVGETVIAGNIITVTMPAGTDVTSLVPEITVSADAAVSPASGIAQDFTNAVTYTVTAENGTTKIYTVKVNLKMTDINPPEENVDKPGWIIPGRPSKPSKPSFDDVPFHDVVKSDWFYDEVSYVYHNGLMNGTRPGEFEPETAITRSMIVTILYRLEGEPMNNYVGLFADVENYKWYTDAVEWAAKNDIVTGYTTGNFGPMDPVTREQLAAILYRYADFCGYDVDGSANLKSFNDDETISNYAVDAMEWAVANNLLNGSHNNLAPKANATRAQAAAILMRFCEEAAK
ncbi:MAG: S-layer homology domain-containing protein, partial [Faecousia sp.]